MRCFIAINLDESLKKELASAIGSLAAGNWDVKWVSAHNLHITLKFLGDVSDNVVDEIKVRLKTVVSRHRTFAITLRGVGVFPDRRKPRVVWIDILNSEEMHLLQVEVEESLLSLGFSKETRLFSPHLTIGRIRSIGARDREPFMMAVETIKDRDFGNIGVDRIFFMRSDLKPTGAQYSIVAEFPLTKEEQ